VHQRTKHHFASVDGAVRQLRQELCAARGSASDAADWGGHPLGEIVVSEWPRPASVRLVHGRAENFARAGLLEESDNAEIVGIGPGLQVQLHVLTEIPPLFEFTNLH
jgi:hypothetical protein